MLGFRMKTSQPRRDYADLFSELSPMVHPSQFPVILVQQFYLPLNLSRAAEIKYCLKQNLLLDGITKIVLLNERRYSIEEMGIDDTLAEKLYQVVIGSRLSYSMFFRFASSLDAYVILSNSDIHFDSTVSNLLKTTLFDTKSCFAQSRIEKDGRVIGPRPDSQDCWIFHSKWLSTEVNRSDFAMGLPGCDNRILRLIVEAGFKVYNEPMLIKCHHVHSSNIRNYTSTDTVAGAQAFIWPAFRLSDPVSLMNNIKLFWQYPVITEKTMFLQNKQFSGYFAFPWATIIDKDKRSARFYLNTLLINKTELGDLSITCCQHIRFRNIAPFIRSLGVKTLFTPHKTIGEDFICGIKLLPCPLFAVNFEDPTRNHEFRGVEFNEVSRDLLYSFIGAWQPNYLTDVRKRIFTLPSRRDSVVLNTGEWHFEKQVYSSHQNVSGSVIRSNNLAEKTSNYNRVLLRSRFSLCPSGSGPNSIRLWESLACGSIPVILSDTLDLPHHPLWEDAVIRFPEKQVHRLPELLEKISFERVKNMRENCLKIYDDFKNNYRFGSDVKNSVPKVLFTSYKCSKEDPTVSSILQKWSILNPEFEIKYFSDTDLDKFFAGTPYETTFTSLRNGVAKADLFRICYINIFGGYWFDLDLKPVCLSVPKTGNAHLFDCGFGNISYMLIGGKKCQLFDDVIKLVEQNVTTAKGSSASGLVNITGPAVIQQLVSSGLDFKVKNGTFMGENWWQTFLRGSDYEFSYKRVVLKSLKSTEYERLQTRYGQRRYWEYKYL